MTEKQIFTFSDAQKLAGPRCFQTMVKPAGSACNLNCSYCYYLDKARQYGMKEPKMSPELLEKYIREYIAANEVDTVTFCWYGGEPTLLGINYFEMAIGLQAKYAQGKHIVNTVQTNGTLIDENWCRFFAKHDFLVGISLDGPKSVHDAFRKDKGEAPTWDRVMKSIRMFKRFGVQFNTLSVVNSQSVRRPLETYLFFRDTVGSKYMQFLPALEHVVRIPGEKRPVIVSPDTEGAVLAPWSVSATEYGKFLVEIFDYWVKKDVGEYFVQMFDATLANYCGVSPGVCSMAQTCGDALVVEHNGDVYPCDHFVYPEYLLGNLNTESLEEIYNSPRRARFGLLKRNALPQSCLECKYYFACHGECPKHRFDKAEDGSLKNSLCPGLKMFFEHADPYMQYMRNCLEKRQSPAWVMNFRK
ncbi:MAG: anaerobic sulfatase maturase [Candidatus Cryptobacteroides sp.]